jgi:peroxiredoxin
MNKTKCLNPGDNAPDFILTDHNSNEFKLSDFKGKNILLSFHPLAWTSVCAKQMQSLEKHQKDFKELDTIAVGINVDSVPSKKAWADSLEIKITRLLSDFWPHGKTAEIYNIFRNKDGFSERANILINKKGKIEFIRIYELSELPDINEILTILRNIMEEEKKVELELCTQPAHAEHTRPMNNENACDDGRAG